MELVTTTPDFCKDGDLTNSFHDIFESYDSDLEGLKKIADFVSDKTGLINYFTAGNSSSTYMSNELFELKGAISSLDADYWSRVINMTDVISCMPADKRNEWSEMIHKRKTPSFNRETVVATIGYLLASRGMFFADKVDGVFRNLSGKHVTNSPMAFREKMIINYVVDKFGYIEHRRAEYIHDLRCVVAQLRGMNQPAHWLTGNSLSSIAKDKAFGQWFEFDGGAFKVKIFKVGTAHIEIHPEIALKLNRILATKYPGAIPDGKRENKKQVKEFTLLNNQISYETASLLADLNRRSGKSNSAWVSYKEMSKTLKKELEMVIVHLGGTFNKGEIKFAVWPTSALSHITRTCALPDVKSRQFYPTKTDLAGIMIDLLEADDSHVILEPSAGQGGLVDMIENKNRIQCVEICELNCKVLEDKGYSVIPEDFLKLPVIDKYDRIIMNPPFSENRATLHTQKAFEHLAVDGVLVACLPASLKGKVLIVGKKHEWSEVFEDSFDGTSVRVCILTLKS